MRPIGLVAVSIVALGVGELALHQHFSQAAPRVEGWRQLRSEIEGRATPGTLVVVAPAWAEPNARYAWGDAVMPLEHVARADESRFARAIEVGILGQESPLLAGWSEASRERHGPFVIRTLSNPNAEVVRYDFLAELKPAAATVSVERGRSSKSCPFKKASVSNGDLHGHPTFPSLRFDCPGEGPWLFVGKTVVEDEHYRPRHCIWAHPSTKGTLTIRFHDVPIGSKIRGYGALPYFVERETHGAPVTLEVSVGGRPIGVFTHRDGQGWSRFEFPTPDAAGQRQTVEFRVRTKRAKQREFCFQADVR